MTPWTRPILTGNSLAEKVHNVNRLVNALQKQGVSETKIMVEHLESGAWKLTHLPADLAVLLRTFDEYATDDALHAALDARLADVEARATREVA